MARALLAAALFGRAFAQTATSAPTASPTIAGYKAGSWVTPHAKIDLDMKEIVDAVGLGTAAGITEAINVYENGGNGGAGNSVKGSGAIRTIQGFATSGEAKMTTWTTYPVYKAYYDDFNYADTFIKNAAMHTNTNADDQEFREQMIKKGAAYMAVWMYVLHEFEDAIKDCTTGDITANDGEVHAWDEGWAFYAGSLTGENHPAADKGQLLYGLAQSRADNFGTTTNDVANANTVALAAANAGRNALQQAKCADVPAQLVILTQQMTVPLVQGTLKYAWEADPAQTGSACAGQTAPFDAGCSKAWAEGWTFASAILPQLDACDAAAAKTVKDALDGAATAPMVGGLAAVKSAIEGCYTKMGITCDEVGEYQKSGVVFNGMCKCAGSVASKCPAESDAAAAPALALGAAAAAAGALLL